MNCALISTILCLGLISSGTCFKNRTDSIRTGKILSLFQIVQFRQDPCSSTVNPGTRGTCMTADECSGKSGKKEGNCASGFGVCCVFYLKTCGGTVNNNCTYIRNPEYPATAAASKTCEYKFARIQQGICQIRLDFETLTTDQPSTTVVADGDYGICRDTVVATSPTGRSPPTVCGTLSGQHMYVETGDSGDAANLKLTFGMLAATRTYNIKATYVECTSQVKAPADCVQYFTGKSGSFSSFNFAGGSLIASQNYATCIRQAEGYCSINYDDASSTAPFAFDLFSDNAGAIPPTATRAAVVMAETLCKTYVIINESARNMVFCGGILSSVQGATVPGSVSATQTPFVVRTVFGEKLGTIAGTTSAVAGYNIEFAQVPC